MRKEDSIQDVEWPNILILCGGQSRDINCNYENCEIKFAGNENVPDFFNRELLNNKSDLVMFFNEKFCYAEEKGLYNMAEIFMDPKYSQVGGVYSDTVVEHEGKFLFNKTNPYYDRSIYDNMTMMDIPYLIRSQVAPRFNTNIESLYLWDGFLQIAQKCMIIHIPELLVKITKGLDMGNMSKDLETLRELYYGKN